MSFKLERPPNVYVDDVILMSLTLQTIIIPVPYLWADLNLVSCALTLPVMNDIITTMFNKKFLEELFKPQELYSKKALRTVFDRLAHASIMRLNQASMDKVWMESCHLVHVQDTLYQNISKGFATENKNRCSLLDKDV